MISTFPPCIHQQQLSPNALFFCLFPLFLFERTRSAILAASAAILYSLSIDLCVVMHLTSVFAYTHT
ncbi:unnamed protein product [Cuscuta campestris]|uniref:Uncharacterized protein n=1 Tax=Cuscuta campestris TaxID=132261 RepID=A0A484K7A3_9ASTE|nr:unnamed protein product [Cuscuta campestris]